MCLEEEMDDYISKPSEIEEFVKTVPKSPGAMVIDASAIANLKAILGPQAENLLPKLIDDYIADAGKLQIAAEKALNDCRPEDLRRAAHTLKSTSASFGAMFLHSLCKELEMLARSGKLSGTNELLRKIKTEFEKVKTDLQKMKQGAL